MSYGQMYLFWQLFLLNTEKLAEIEDWITL